MVLFIFLLVFGAGAFAAFKLLAPEMYLTLDLSKINLPWRRPKLMPDAVSVVPVDPESIKTDDLPIAIDLPVQPEDLTENIEKDLVEPVFEQVPTNFKLESLLNEKNNTIDALSRKLTAERSNRQEFEKVKEIMADEILRLKNQVKELKRQKELDHA